MLPSGDARVVYTPSSMRSVLHQNVFFIVLLFLSAAPADAQLLSERLQRGRGVRLLFGHLLVQVALRRYLSMFVRGTCFNP